MLFLRNTLSKIGLFFDERTRFMKTFLYCAFLCQFSAFTGVGRLVSWSVNFLRYRPFVRKYTVSYIKKEGDVPSFLDDMMPCYFMLNDCWPIMVPSAKM